MAMAWAMASCAGPPGGGLAEIHELDLLAGHNHSSETTVAVSGRAVVVVAINQAFEQEDSFVPAGLPFRRVAAYVSRDGGGTFSPPIDVAPSVAETSDPVVRAGADGTFWLSVFNPMGTGLVLRSDDDGASWQTVVEDLPIVDKEWLVPGPGAVYVGAVGGYFRIPADGSGVTHATDAETGTGHALDGHLAADGVRFLKSANAMSIVRWDGASATAAREGDAIATLGLSDYTRYSGSLGETPGGAIWIVHGTRSSNVARVVARVRNPDGTESVVPVSGVGEVAFMPAARLDAAGRLHVVWYDSSGATGVLRYAASTDASLSTFTTAEVIDDNACPGSGWYPEPTPGSFSGRRLREYIDLAVSDGVVHIAWTHAPTAPSRVRTTTRPAL